MNDFREVRLADVYLNDDGTVDFQSHDEKFSKHVLTAGVYLPSRKRSRFPKDGAEFIDACLIEFDGTVVRARGLEWD